jgi:uncharacterized protein
VTWLLDVSALVAHLVQSHEHHSRVNAWWPGRAFAVCPITELGFLRVACALGSTMEDARAVLAEFFRGETVTFIPGDRRALDSLVITTPRKTTDIYLADLATARGWRLATLDEGISHPAAELIPESRVQP